MQNHGNDLHLKIIGAVVSPTGLKKLGVGLVFPSSGWESLGISAILQSPYMPARRWGGLPPSYMHYASLGWAR